MIPSRNRLGLSAAVAAFAALITLLPVVSFAQAGGAPPPPPPPPSEGLNPATAPSSSMATPPPAAIAKPVPTDSAKPAVAPSAPAASSADGAPPPPPPPTEGLDPNIAPATSREAAADASGSAAPAASPSAADTPVATATPLVSPEPSAASASDDAEAPDAAPTDVSPATVFKLDFMRRALWMGLVVSGVCAFLGVYVVLRRIVFVGVALSQMSSAGVALSLILSGVTSLAGSVLTIPMVGSVLTMLIGVALLSVRWGGRRIRQDAFIGIGYAVAAAGAVLLVAKSPKGEGDLLNVLFGNILTVAPGEAFLTAGALGVVLLFYLVFYKELLFVSFDPDTAAAAGYASRLWELMLYISIGLTIAFAIHAVGVLLPFAALVLPSVAALLLTKRMTSALLASVILGMIPVPIGLYISYVSELPSGETIVATSFLLLVLAGLYTKIKGTAL